MGVCRLKAFRAATRAGREHCEGVFGRRLSPSSTLRLRDLARPLLRFGEKRVQRRHHLRAFADCGGDTFGRACPHVADRKHAAHTRLQRPASRVGFAAGEYEPFTIQHYAGTLEPVGVGIGADE